MGLLNFGRWSILFESDKFVDEIKMVKDTLKGELGELHSVSNWSKFKRPGEPAQTSILFTNDKMNSFILNFTNDGKLYSIDFMKPSSKEPTVTMYANGADTEDMISAIPEVIKNPRPGVKLEKVKESIDEKTAVADKTEKKEKKDMKLQPGWEKITLKKPKEKTETDVHIADLEKNIGEYAFGDKDTLFIEMRKYIDMVIKGTQPALMLTGMPGLGKTFITDERLKAAHMVRDKDYVVIKGQASAAGMYLALFEHNGQLIIFDDCDSIFDYKDAINILKGALESSDRREISWLVAKPLKTAGGAPAPHKFDFTGRIIFISNKAQKELPPALKSRSFVFEVALSPKDMVEYIESQLKRAYPEVDMSTKKFALQTIKSVAAKDPTVQINFRTLDKAIKILQDVPDLEFAKTMIGHQCSYK